MSKLTKRVTRTYFRKASIKKNILIINSPADGVVHKMADVSVHEVAGGAGEGLWCRMKAPPTPEEARDTDGREEATDIDSFTENEMFFF